MRLKEDNGNMWENGIDLTLDMRFEIIERIEDQCLPKLGMSFGFQIDVECCDHIHTCPYKQ